MKKSSLVKSISLITLLTLIGQFVAFFKEATIASFFGISFEGDAFIIATQIPQTLFAMFASAIPTVILPLYSKIKNEDSIENSSKFISNFLTIFLLFSTIFSILGIIFTNQIVSLLAPTYSGENYEMVVFLTRISFSSIIFSACFSVIKAVHHTWKSFYYPIIIGYIQNILIIVTTILFAEKYGIIVPVLVFVISLIIESLLMLITIRKNYVYTPIINLKSNYLKKVFSLVLPVLLGVGIAEINRIVDRILATSLEEGYVSALNYASKSVGVFSGILVASIGTIVLQRLSSDFSRNNIEQYIKSANRFISMIFLITIPITIGILFLDKEIITILFGRGNFTEKAIEKTTSIFNFYAIGLLFLVLRDTLSKMYYSMGNTKTPMINSSLGVILNIILNIILVNFLGAEGLALATSITSFFICVLLIIGLIKKFGIYRFKPAYIVFFKSTVSAALMFFIIYIIPKPENIYLRILVCVSSGVITYFISHLTLKTKSVVAYFNIILKRLK